MTTSETIVTVWYDETSDSDEPQWIVDTDLADGGESETVRCFRDRADAVTFAQKYAAKKSLRLEIRG